MKDNIFIALVRQGKIRTPDDLKRVYRKMVVGTHPDSVGSDRFVGEFIELGSAYEEAKQYLSRLSRGEEKTSSSRQNMRLRFFRAFKEQQDLELAFKISGRRRKVTLQTADDTVSACFRDWKEDYAGLYKTAWEQYLHIRKEKPEGPYRKKALYFNLRPVLHNIISFHLTGRRFYHTQVRQNLAAVMQRLVERDFFALKQYLEFLIADMEYGPALFS